MIDPSFFFPEGDFPSKVGGNTRREILYMILKGGHVNKLTQMLVISEPKMCDDI